MFLKLIYIDGLLEYISLSKYIKINLAYLNYVMMNSPKYISQNKVMMNKKIIAHLLDNSIIKVFYYFFVKMRKSSLEWHIYRILI